MGLRSHAGKPLRDHIAKVAALLYYSDGVQRVGMDRIAAEAGVTKRTLYRHFPSKEALVAGALRLAPRVHFPRLGSPIERILGAFAVAEEFLTDTQFRGCPYIIFAAELTDRRHPARTLIEELLAKRRRWFRERAAEAGAPEPDRLAEQLDVIFDGAVASGAKRGDLRPVRAAMEAAKLVLVHTLEQAGVRRPALTLHAS